MINTRAAVGLHAPPVRVEVHCAGGLPAITIVGLPEAAVREARDRVRAALQNSGFCVPPRRFTIHLAPADLPKDGGRFDLAIAVGILLSSGQLQADTDALEFLGELSLSGELCPVNAVLPAVLACRAAGRSLVIPQVNGDEAGLAGAGSARLAHHLLAVCASLRGEAALPLTTDSTGRSAVNAVPDIAEVRGQQQAKRALEIAAAGAHNLLLLGPPGCGKSMLAHRLPGLMPPLSASESLEVASLQSASGRPPASGQWGQIPLRAPHHSASAAALVGGGSIPRPGEISLAHRGILFLDELPEFSRQVLEVLREPLETGKILISRARAQSEFPAQVQLIAAMNPCPCGFLGDPSGPCRCTSEQVARYRGRISGPLLDRIDLQLVVPKMPADQLLTPVSADGASSSERRARVIAARERQLARAGKANAQLGAAELQRDAALGTAHRRLLEQAADRLQLSARGLHRVVKVARTIADLAAEDELSPNHLAEALQYRQLERR